MKVPDLGLRAAIVCLGAAMVLPAMAADDGSATTDNTAPSQLSGVEVVTTVPLPGLGSPLSQVPSNVQQANSKDLESQHTLDLGDYLNNNFSGINVNESQDNPFQPDVSYHGFTASPLLGTPQGISVYQDGVRINESLGDTVNWDLIPESAIKNVTLISGSNPVFGLNTLGGALSVETKNGRDNPGTEIEAYGGSYGRGDGNVSTGGTIGKFDYFVTGNYFHEDGWRAQSPSLVRQAFGKVGWQNDSTDVHLAYNWANNILIGNGVQPQSLLNVDYSSIFTAPDLTENKLHFVNLTGSHSFNDTLQISGNVYYRQLITRTFNGDANDDYAGPTDDCSGAASSDDIQDCAAGINHGSRLSQRGAGVGVQLTESHDLFHMQNQAVVGASFDRTRDGFTQNQQYADLTASRSTTVIDSPFNPLTTVNSLNGTNQILGVYVTDTLSPNELLHFIASARYNRNVESLDGFSVDDDGDTNPITVDHSFHRINPALGFTITPNPRLTFYGDYNEGSRAPTVIELGCADPAIPCGLPNDFASDPDLAQVVARTFEVGARGSIYGKWLRWSADVYHTRSSNDIQFIASSVSAGYFDNVGATRRQGGDLGLGGELGHLTWRLVYSFVDATYQSTFQVGGASNSSSVCSDPTDEDTCLITVRPGNRIPLIPRNTGRLMLGYAVTPRWHVGVNVIASSGAYLHGDENNANVAGGTTGTGDEVDGSGRVGGYAVVNLNTDLNVNPYIDFFLRMNNVLDRKYATAGFLTDNPFNPNGSFRQDPDDDTNENAVSPAIPRSVWVGVRIHWM